MASTKVPIELSSTPGIVDNSNATAITIDSNENVALTGGLTLANSQYLSSTDASSNAPRMLGINSGNTTYIAPIDAYAGGDVYYGVSANVANQAFYTAGSERLRIDSSGNVGIGTSSPARSLHIRSTGEGSGLFLERSSNYGFVLYNEIETTTETFHLGFVSNGTFSSDILVANELGNVGIGTSSPATKLHVTGTVGAFHSNNDNRILMYNNGTVGSISVTYGTTGPYLPLTFLTSDTERMRIDNSGRVGIFNSSAVNYSGAGARSLVVGSNSSASDPHGITIVGGSSSTSNLAFTDNAGDGSANDYRGLFQYFHPDDSLRVFVASTERMRIHSGGTVSIGSSNNNGAIFAGNPPSLYAYAAGANNKVANFHYGSTDNYEAVEFGHARATGGNTAIVIGFRNAVGSSVGTISMTATNTAYNTSSDARLKDVTGGARGLEVINGLNPVSYNWKESGMADEGLLAQEVMEIVPNAVVENNKGYYFMDYSKLITPLIKAVQEQQVLIEQLQAEVALLKGE